MSQGNPIALAAAEHIAGKWLDQYRSLINGDVDITLCGSIRRKEKMVRDIDILVIDEINHGTLANDAKFDNVSLNIYCVNAESKGAGLLFLTGCATFNISLRARAKRMGLKLNRYGVFKGVKCIASETEESIFKALGLAYVKPEGRRSHSSGKKGIEVASSSIGSTYEVFITDVHGYDFCTCRGFQYRRECRHIAAATEKVS